MTGQWRFVFGLSADVHVQFATYISLVTIKCPRFAILPHLSMSTKLAADHHSHQETITYL